MEKGFVQVYTGNGKGKTTAAIGLAVRAAGAGLKVFFAQFVKGMKYSEITALERFHDCIEIHQFGRGCFIVRTPEKEDIEAAGEGLKKCEDALTGGKYDLVILDEANIAVYFGLFTVEELLRVISLRRSNCEVVVTGRYAARELIDTADLVTEMKEIKHYYTRGIDARTGIER
jgi:cob(I)alamin adenosyltransferase